MGGAHIGKALQTMSDFSSAALLRTLADTGALLTGHFELRSGLHSAEFFQCANLLRHPRIAERLCTELVQRVPAAVREATELVIAPALGGILVGHEVARALDRPSIFAEKSDGRLVMRRFTIEPGTKVLVAEDVVTRGGRVQETIDLVRAAGAEVLSVAVLVDRSGGQARFDVPLVALLSMAPRTWAPADCPLCRGGSTPVHPGS